jgi:hypothetical protein
MSSKYGVNSCLSTNTRDVDSWNVNRRTAWCGVFLKNVVKKLLIKLGYTTHILAVSIQPQMREIPVLNLEIETCYLY